MKALVAVLAVFLALSGAPGLGAQQGLPEEGWAEEQGDPAVAERYVSWIEEAIAAGQWQQALAALNRAVDFANVSSDIPYLLATVLLREGSDRGPVLRALSQAITIRRWTRYTEADARLLQARQMIALRRYPAALETLAVRRAAAGEDADSAVLRLEALKGLAVGSAPPDGEAWRRMETLPAPAEFRRRRLETLDRYPRDPRPLRLLFDYAVRKEPTRDDIALMEIALKRLPFLLETDPELAWMAAPFVTDVDEARRLVGSYRSGSLLTNAGGFRPAPASIALALNLGLLDDIDAVGELFGDGVTTIDKGLILGVGELLRSEEGRDALAQKLHSFTGTISEDEDRDGIPEGRAVCRQGVVLEYHCDVDQDGLDDMAVAFELGQPRRAELHALPAAGNERAKARVHWERYPSVKQVVLGRETFLFGPEGFMFSPVGFEELCATESYAGLLFPRHDPQSQGLTRRMLSSFAVSVQRPSAEFEGGVESLALVRGVPFRAEVVLGGAVVSATEFENGFPLIQRVDLDRDGRMETIRRYRPPVASAEFSESDWNNDGVFEYVELYHENGSVVYSWDFDLQ
ncbi:MAG: hypothetical protein LBQ69_03400 [Treponema sp.]|jgi:tetratricopeptide (TPR) repeat protein|nr:hypothetical protein [Treponema sp.]